MKLIIENHPTEANGTPHTIKTGSSATITKSSTNSIK